MGTVLCFRSRNRLLFYRIHGMFISQFLFPSPVYGHIIFKVQYGYVAGLTIELQQYNGQWNTIKTWNTSDGTVVSLSKDWYVVSGYQYRLRLEHTAINSNNAVIDSYTSYSKTITYS